MDKSASLTPSQREIMLQKGTELAFQGEYNLTDKTGSYLCRRCGFSLFREEHKFISSCGWPSFDDEVPSAIKRVPDKDGVRTEICCNRCDSHLGHVFHGEGLTSQNLRHCVNSLSIDFVESETVSDTEEAIVAGGCFWGIEALFKKEIGIVKTEVGYTGGKKENPTYDEVCRGDTGHFEALRIVYDMTMTNYESIIKFFLECHDITQANGQGLDIGQQYRSAIFYYNENQKEIALNLIAYLKKQGLYVATECFPVSMFWQAEDYHQDYFTKQGKSSSCHRRTKRFD